MSLPIPGQPARKPPHPVVFDVEYPKRLSRLLIFVKWLLIIPQVIVVYLLLAAFGVLTFIAWFAILFTGRYPRGFFEFSSGVMRWSANVFAYFALLRDEYPPFSWEPGEYPLTLAIPMADRQSRFRLFIRWFAIIPNMLAFYFVQVAWFVTSFIAWWSILFTGRYPRGLFKFNVGVMRWWVRQASYAYLLRDEYPPYSINANAAPGNEVVSAIVGVPLGAAYVSLQFVPLIMLGRGETVYVDAALLDEPARLARERPEASSANLHITLTDYEPRRDCYRSDGYCIRFTVDIEKTGPWPAFYTPYFFSVSDCYSGESYSGDAGYGSTRFRQFWGEGSETDQVIEFATPRLFEPCTLSYFTGGGILRFRFE